MAKFSGVVGYAHAEETAPGVYEDIVTEHAYMGDVVRNSRKLREGDKVNNDISVGNSISIVADEYAYGNIFAMKYVQWMGQLWVISDIEVQSPRLLLRLGGVYRGPTPAPDSP